MHMPVASALLQCAPASPSLLLADQMQNSKEMSGYPFGLNMRLTHAGESSACPLAALGICPPDSPQCPRCLQAHFCHLKIPRCLRKSQHVLVVLNTSMTLRAKAYKIGNGPCVGKVTTNSLPATHLSFSRSLMTGTAPLGLTSKSLQRHCWRQCLWAGWRHFNH